MTAFSMSHLYQTILEFSFPPMDQRERYTLRTTPLVFVSTFPLILAAFIRLRHPNLPILFKFFILFACLPIIPHFLLQRYFMDVWYDSIDGIPYSMNHLNFVCGMAIGIVGLKFIELLFLGNNSDFEVKGWEEYSRMQEKEKGKLTDTDASYSLRKPAFFPGSYIPLEIDLVMTIRGQGYNWASKESKGGYKSIIESQKLTLKPEIAKRQKWSLVRRVAWSALTNLILMDICDSIIKDVRIFPAAGRLGGGPIEEAANGILGSSGPLVITFTTGVFIFVSLQADYSVGYLAHLLITSPARIPIVAGKWEPLPFYRPYAATSLSSFWSNHWHSFVRRTFTVFAYKPVLQMSRKLNIPSKAAKILALIATFALSGLLHEGCLEGQSSYFYDRQLHLEHGHLNIQGASKETQNQYGYGAKGYATTYGFTIQVLFLMIEDFWLSLVEPQLVFLFTGRKNSKVIEGKGRNILGWIWTYSCMMYSGYYISDVWHSHGLINAVVSLRLTQRIPTFIYNHLYSISR